MGGGSIGVDGALYSSQIANSQGIGSQIANLFFGCYRGRMVAESPRRKAIAGTSEDTGSARPLRPPPSCFDFTSEPVFRLILNRRYSDLIQWPRDVKLAKGAALFFEEFVNSKISKLHCRPGKSARGACDGKIHIALKLTLRERQVFAALRARDEERLRLHLTALGFVGAAEHSRKTPYVLRQRRSLLGR
jgi:hypothetical protein